MKKDSRGTILCNKCRKAMKSDLCSCGNEKCYIRLYHKGKMLDIRKDLSGHIFYYDTALSYLVAVNSTDRKVLVTPDMDVEHQLELWLKEKREAKEANEISRGYLIRLEGIVKNHFADAFANQHVLMIDNDAVKMFKNSLKTQKIKTRKNIMGALHAFMRWLYTEGKIENMPYFAPIKGDDAMIKQALTVEEQVEALKALPKKHLPIFLFGTETGLRSAELCAAQVGDVNLRTGMMVVQRTISAGVVRETTKGRHKDMIALSEDALRIASENMEGKSKGAWLFLHPDTSSRYTPNRLYQLWVKWREAEYADITVHELIRHSFCTQLMANTSINTLLAQDALRHKSSSMVEKYNHRNAELMRQYVNGRKGLRIVHSKGTEKELN